MKLHLPKVLRLALMPALLSVTLMPVWAEEEILQPEDVNSEYEVELALSNDNYVTIDGKNILNIGLGRGTVYTDKDFIVGNLVDDNGEVKVKGDCDMVGAVENGVFLDYSTINNNYKSKFTKNLKIGTAGFLGIGAKSNNLTIYGEGRVVLGGQNGSNYQTLTADTVRVYGNEGVTNLQASNAHLKTLEIHSGRVELHAGGNFRSGNDVYGGNAKRTEIAEKIIMKGGSLLLGSEGTVMGAVTDKETGEVQNHYLTKLSGSIEQSGNSSIKVAGWSLAKAGLQIVQAEGTLEFRDRLDITGSGTNKIWQGYEYDASGKLQEKVVAATTAEGDSIASKITFGDLGKGTYEINQANTGTIQIKNVQSDASITINQSGAGSIVLGSGFDKATVTVSESVGTLEFQSNVKLDTLTKDGGAIKVAEGSTMETTNSLNWNQGEKQSKDTSSDIEFSGKVSLSGGSISSADEKVTITGNLSADGIVVNNGKVTNNGFIVVGGQIVLNAGTTLVNNGTIASASTFSAPYALMTAEEQVTAANLIIVEAEASLDNSKGKIESSVLVNGGTVTLGTGTTQDITMNDGIIYVTGTVETGSLTLNGGTMYFSEGATVELSEQDIVNLNGTNIVIMVDNVNTLEETSIVNLFQSSSEDDATANITNWEGTTVTFMDDNNGSVTGTISGAVDGGLEVTIPEPATATLSLLALAGLAMRRRRAA